MQFFDPIWKKTGAKISDNLTSYFSFARSRFLSRSTIWMPEIAYIHLAHTDRYSLYKRTSYLSETGPEGIRSWDFDWQVSRTCDRNRLTWVFEPSEYDAMWEWITVNLLG